MASFDIIESGGKSYKLFWEQRAYLVRLAAIPVLLKILSWNMVLALGWEADYVKQAMVMLPAYFAEGWMVSHFVRLIFFGQTWPFRPTGNVNKDMEQLHDRALGIMRGTLCYVVIQFLMSGLVAIIYEFMKGQPETIDPSTLNAEMTFTMFFGSCVLLGLIIWGFRFVWYYIPAAVNHPLKSFNFKIREFNTSFYILGVWLICFVPLVFLYNIFLSEVFPSAGKDAGNFATIKIVRDMCTQIMDTVIVFITTGGIAYGFGQIIIDQKKKLD